MLFAGNYEEGLVLNPKAIWNIGKLLFGLFGLCKRVLPVGVSSSCFVKFPIRFRVLGVKKVPMVSI